MYLNVTLVHVMETRFMETIDFKMYYLTEEMGKKHDSNLYNNIFVNINR